MSPGRIPIGELTAKQRRQILGRATRPAPVRTRPGPELDTPAQWRCFACGLVSTAYKPAERHADQNRHRRIVFDLEGTT